MVLARPRPSIWTLRARADILPGPTQVSPNAWAWIGPYEGPTKANQGFRMNFGFVVGAEAVAVIDSGYTPDMARAMLEHVQKVTPRPVRYVINTNSQPHRFMGNDVFRAVGARIIAAREAAERMASEGADFAATITNTLELPATAITVPRPPDVLIREGAREELDLGGGVRLAVEHFGRTHTRGSLIVRVMPDRTVFAGDVLYGGRLLALLPESSIGGWITAFERLRGLDAALFVPGHGQPGPLEGFEHPTYAYLNALKRHMDEAVKQGTDISQATASFNATPWKELANFADLDRRNASLAYLESEVEGF